MKNNSGNITLAAIFIFTSLFGALSFFLHHQRSIQKRIKNRVKMYKCSQHVAKATKKLVIYNETLNKALYAKITLKILGSIWPWTKALDMAADKAVAVIQYGFFAQFIAEIMRLHLKEYCPLSMGAYLSPYKIKFPLFIEKNSLKQTILRDKTWKLSLLSCYFDLKINFEIQGSQNEPNISIEETTPVIRVCSPRKFFNSHDFSFTRKLLSQGPY